MKVSGMVLRMWVSELEIDLDMSHRRSVIHTPQTLNPQHQIFLKPHVNAKPCSNLFLQSSPGDWL